ncbi:hypothetical protein GCM10022225_16490 [Plantactinospora mayteni]|uniref:Uncharacterized protein n=1 Tax=Plantactinospora mayteni TaxID=566021 RepID=A0ABQ4EG83_9ACTN|nr:hypothetical protein [Plantactinospora mayteni]GIG93723.1 hypothetical protein Pma05_02960 [Plantactinospora mayteni]
MADERALTYRPRPVTRTVAKWGVGVLALVVAGVRMTSLVLERTDGFVPVVLVWALAVGWSGGFVETLETRLPRLRPHAWTLLLVAVVAGVSAEFAIPVPGALAVTLLACLAACAAGTWLTMDSTTDLMVWRRRGLGEGPAIRFSAAGVDYQAAHRRSPVVHLDWPEVRAVELHPDRNGRPTLCVFPEAGSTAASIVHGGEIDGYAIRELYRLQWFGTPIALYLHQVRGPALPTLDRAMNRWTDGRLGLDATG